MKKVTFLTMLVGVFSLNSFAQGNRVPVKLGITQLVSESMGGGDEVIVGYHVEEKINMRFGGSTTTYNVSSLAMVSKVDLGPGNTRKITPIYGKPRVRIDAVGLNGKQAVAANDMASTSVAITPVKINAIIPAAVSKKAKVAQAEPVVIAPATVTLTSSAKVATIETKADEMTITIAKPKSAEGETSAKINILHTYERTLERGYESVEMLRRVADGRFFSGDLAIAARWYTDLFAKTKDLDAVYYYRYAQCLKAVGQPQKAEEMMKIFDAKK